MDDPLQLRRYTQTPVPTKRISSGARLQLGGQVCWRARPGVRLARHTTRHRPVERVEDLPALRVHRGADRPARVRCMRARARPGRRPHDRHAKGLGERLRRRDPDPQPVNSPGPSPTAMPPTDSIGRARPVQQLVQRSATILVAGAVPGRSSRRGPLLGAQRDARLERGGLDRQDQHGSASSWAAGVRSIQSDTSRSTRSRGPPRTGRCPQAHRPARSSRSSSERSTASRDLAGEPLDHVAPFDDDDRTVQEILEPQVADVLQRSRR